MNSIHPPVRTPSPAPYTVLFSVSESSLPEPLPTPEEIENSTGVIKHRRARCTARVGGHYVVKFGSQVDPLEGDNMRFARQQSPDFPVPQVFAIYQREVTPRTKITYIIMEKVDGVPLDGLWDSLSSDRKADVAGQLRQALDTLRRANSLGYFGSADMTQPQDDIFWTDEPIRRNRETFDTEAEFIQGIIGKYVTYCGRAAPHKAEYYRRILPTALQGSGEAIFTHNNLRRKNILVCADGRIVILGWAFAGWYPSYWEYSKAMHLCTWEDDWHEYVGKILQQEYPNQHAWMDKVRNELWSQRIVR